MSWNFNAPQLQGSSCVAAKKFLKYRCKSALFDDIMSSKVGQ